MSTLHDRATPERAARVGNAYDAEQITHPRRGLDRLLDRMAGPDRPPVPVEHADRVGRELDSIYELRSIAATLRELRDIQSGQIVSKPVRVIIDAARPFALFEVDHGAKMHAIQVDNPSAVTVELRFDGTQPLPGNADNRVPKQTGRVLVRAFDVVTIGIDPAVMPAGQTPVFVTFFSRPLAPATYAFAP